MPAPRKGKISQIRSGFTQEGLTHALSLHNISYQTNTFSGLPAADVHLHPAASIPETRPAYESLQKIVQFQFIVCSLSHSFKWDYRLHKHPNGLSCGAANYSVISIMSFIIGYLAYLNELNYNYY
jgi:hypothetical protein